MTDQIMQDLSHVPSTLVYSLIGVLVGSREQSIPIELHAVN